MKKNQHILIWTIILFLLFAMITGTFCYFLGKTDSLGEAFNEFLVFGYGLFPLFLVVIGVAVYDVRRVGRKGKH